MNRRAFLSFRGEISPLAYAVIAPALLLSQHAMVAIAYWARGFPVRADMPFWMLPLRRLAELPELPGLVAAGGFAFALIVAWGLAVLSFRRAAGTEFGDTAATLAIVPGVQTMAVLALIFLPRSRRRFEEEEDETKEEEPAAQREARQIAVGVLAGVTLIVAAVAVSALSFGAYGWGLFVSTPFLVGVTTGFIVNRGSALSSGRTASLVMLAASLGSFALIMLALEGIVCLIMAAPLGAAVALIGGAIGRGAAIAVHRRRNPLLSVALLPAIFALEAAFPPAVAITIDESIDIAAPPALVWSALTSEAPIDQPPGLVARAGLAYPLRGRLEGEGVGAVRIGLFSTGPARERVTQWAPGRRLAFLVVEQPPSMEEMSPYRRVHAPHVRGYFDTGETRFDLEPLARERTRLRIRATHVLRIEPVLYWEPVARWALGQNVSRVLADLRSKAESAAARRAS